LVVNLAAATLLDVITTSLVSLLVSAIPLAATTSLLDYAPVFLILLAAIIVSLVALLVVAILLASTTSLLACVLASVTLLAQQISLLDVIQVVQ